MIPAVVAAGVAGKRDELVGDLLTAFIVKAPGSSISEEDILNTMAKREFRPLV